MQLKGGSCRLQTCDLCSTHFQEKLPQSLGVRGPVKLVKMLSFTFTLSHPPTLSSTTYIFQKAFEEPQESRDCFSLLQVGVLSMYELLLHKIIASRMDFTILGWDKMVPQ